MGRARCVRIQPPPRRMHSRSTAACTPPRRHRPHRCTVAGSGASLAGAVRHAPCNPVSPADRPSARGRAGSRPSCARSSSSTLAQRRSHAGLGGLLLVFNDATVNAGAPALPAPPVSPPKRARAATQARHTSHHLASHCAGDGGVGQQPGQQQPGLWASISSARRGRHHARARRPDGRGEVPDGRGLQPDARPFHLRL